MTSSWISLSETVIETSCGPFALMHLSYVLIIVVSERKCVICRAKIASAFGISSKTFTKMAFRRAPITGRQTTIANVY